VPPFARFVSTDIRTPSADREDFFFFGLGSQGDADGRDSPLNRPEEYGRVEATKGFPDVKMVNPKATDAQ
jgi:hypothetical protein